MLKILHNEVRELLIKAYEKSHNAREVVENFSIDVSTVYRLVRQKKKIGSVKLRTANCEQCTDKHSSQYNHIVINTTYSGGTTGDKLLII